MKKYKFISVIFFVSSILLISNSVSANSTIEIRSDLVSLDSAEGVQKKSAHDIFYELEDIKSSVSDGMEVEDTDSNIDKNIALEKNNNKDLENSDVLSADSFDLDIPKHEVNYQEYEKNVAEFKNIDIQTVKNFFDEARTGVLYFGRPSCYYCRQFSSELKSFNILIDKQLYYYNTDSEDFDEDAKKFIFEDIGIPGTPTTMFVNNGQIVSAWIGGEKTGKELYDFLFQNIKYSRVR